MEENGAYKKRLIKGSAWTLGGYATRRLLRLLATVIYTRLLLPEAFGLMAIVSVFIQGLAMFTDIGFRPNIIQHERGSELSFLHTAWTVQAIRGAVQLLGACIIAYPVALIYKDPRLGPLLAVKATGILMAGFVSINWISMQRKVILNRITLIGIAQRIISIIVITTWAFISPTVWAFIAGSLTATAFYLLMSYVAIPGPGMRFSWDRDAWQAFFHFGKWIFLSSVMGFFVLQGDRLVMGTFLSLTELGVYYIAYMLSQAVVQIQQTLSNDILLPAYSRYKREYRHDLRRKMAKLRGTIFAFLFPVVCLIAIFAQPIVDFLYDVRYQDAGWMLRILAIGSLGMMVTSTLDQAFLAIGDSMRFFIFQACKAILVVGATIVGYQLYGIVGTVSGVAIAQYAAYPILMLLLHKHGLRNYRLDALAVGGSLIVIALGVWLMSFVQL